MQFSKQHIVFHQVYNSGLERKILRINISSLIVYRLPCEAQWKEPACQCRRLGSIPGSGKIDPWRRKWQPTPIFLPGKSHGQRSLAGYSPWGCKRVGSQLSNQTILITFTIPQKRRAALYFLKLGCVYSYLGVSRSVEPLCHRPRATQQGSQGQGVKPGHPHPNSASAAYQPGDLSLASMPLFPQLHDGWHKRVYYSKN